MNTMLQRLKRLIPTKRKIMQLYFAVLFNANLKGFITGNIYQGSTKQICAPGINCYSCPGAVGACPLGSLQGSFSADHSTIYYVCGILLLYSLMFGRMICGWLCPFGLVQELVYKIKTPKLKKSPVTRLLSWFKYVVLVFFVLVIPIMYAFRDTPLPAFCKYICPAGTLEGGIGLLSNAVNESYFSMLGPLFTWKFLLMVSILVGSIFIFRLFCRFICPLGALYGLFNKISLFGVKLNKNKCTDCGLCQAHCKVDIKHVGDQECISCGECIDVCPTKAISWKGSKIFLKANESTSVTADNKKLKTRRYITRTLVAIVMIAVLAVAIVHYWNEGPDLTPAPEAVNPGTTDVVEGNQEGDLCYGYDLTMVDEAGIGTQTVDPTQTGKITIINFWGTWCTPCVNELPYFDQIASEYGDTVSVFAVHTNMVSETAPEFIGKYYPDSNITFAHDGEGEAYYTTLGGRGTYPYTVVLDENGVIVKVFWESLHYEDLQAVVEAQLSGGAQKNLGNQEGDLCYDFDLTVVDENGIQSETVDPTQTGKIAIINFWGTWCTPCVNELPYFDQIASEYTDTVSVFAVHTNMVSETAPEFIGKYYPDSNITFAHDGEGEAYYTTLGGRGTYPYTVVLDENGVIVKVFWESLHYEDLQAVVETQLNA